MDGWLVLPSMLGCCTAAAGKTNPQQGLHASARPGAVHQVGGHSRATMRGCVALTDHAEERNDLHDGGTMQKEAWLIN